MRPAPTAHQNGKDSREGRYYQTEGRPLLLCCLPTLQWQLVAAEGGSEKRPALGTPRLITAN